MKRRARKFGGFAFGGGFTLPEVLVTVALISILAAVVVPTIAGQLKKGDSNKVGQDVVGIRGAIEQFLTDVRKYPKSIGELTNTIATSGSNTGTLNTTTVYFAADVQRWKGPYLSKDSVTAILTGYGASIKTAFDTCTLSLNSATSTPGGQLYLIISVPGLDAATMLAIDQALDDGVLNTGAIRYVTTGVDTLKYLAMPVQP